MMWCFQVEMIRDTNPTFFDDFWNAPGYVGHQMPDSLRGMLVDEKTTVTRVVTPEGAADEGQPLLRLLVSMGASGSVPDSFGIQVDHPDPDRLFMSRLRVLTGEAARRTMLINNLAGSILTPFSDTCAEMFDGVAAGDEVALDNRDYLAYLYFHHHHVAGDGPPADRRAGRARRVPHARGNGAPIFRQQYCAALANESLPLAVRGNLKCKTILFMNKQDIMVPHAAGMAYDLAARQQLGDRADETHRLWWIDNATHGPPAMIGPSVSETERDPMAWNSRLVDYDPITAQALREFTAWAEDGVAPAPSTTYAAGIDNELELPADAAERGGIQPVVTLRALTGRCESRPPSVRW